ncbi:unnamed protein product [Closterium sp. Yama58-4]|nr:unnamed protein product [Closterium sp. Yama58-4]
MGRVVILAVAAVVVVVGSLCSSYPVAASSTDGGPMTGGGDGGRPTGGWSVVADAATDKHVQELARFAVKTYNSKKNKYLQFASVTSASFQAVAGRKWRINLLIYIGRSLLTTEYQAEIYERPWEGVTKLHSFKKVTSSAPSNPAVQNAPLRRRRLLQVTRLSPAANTLFTMNIMDALMQDVDYSRLSGHVWLCDVFGMLCNK